MNGADVLVKTVGEMGIALCFANAGTTELPMVAALDQSDKIKVVLGLFEGVCTGAADGYGRMSGKPAMTLLHLGPGFANGIANLHNARRAHTPVLNVIGEHATWHLSADPPLAMNIEGLSNTVSHWTTTNKRPEDLPKNVSYAAGMAISGKIATLIIPHDHQEAPCQLSPPSPLSGSSAPLNEEEIDNAATLLLKNAPVALILGREALSRKGLAIAEEIQCVTGCDLLSETFPAKVERGSELPIVTRIPYFPEMAMEMLSKYEAVILIGVNEPVAFFGYPGGESRLLSQSQLKAPLGTEDQDLLQSMNALLQRLKTPLANRDRKRMRPTPEQPGVPDGDLNPLSICQAIAALQPKGAIIVEEGLTTSTAYYDLSLGSPYHTLLPITGGAIGYGMPAAVGAALACPDRPVINIQADGSALYTVQSLWTQAREGLNVTTLICSNRSYSILKLELARAGIHSPGRAAKTLTELTCPEINWVKIAEGFGVPAISVSKARDLADGIEKGLSRSGPFLIEMVF